MEHSESRQRSALRPSHGINRLVLHGGTNSFCLTSNFKAKGKRTEALKTAEQ
jgi:hypothetical protein